MNANEENQDETLPDGWEQRSDARAPELVHAGEILRTDAKRVAAREIVKAIDDATSIVFVVTFLLSDAAIVQALEDAAHRGVHVYVLLSAETRLEDAVRDGEFNRRVYEEHLAMLARLAGWCCIRSARGFHAKAVLVDPMTKGAARGFLLTANLGGEPLERNEELVVRLRDDEVAQVWHHGVRAFWTLAEHEFLSPGESGGHVKGLPVVADRRVTPSSTTGAILATTPDRQLRSAVEDLVAGAGRRIVVACFGFDADDPIVAALCEKARDLDVVVLARRRPKNERALLALARAGATVLGFDYLHAKAVLVDDQRGLIMSANIEKNGLDQGFELGIRLDAERSQSLSRLLLAWERSATWQLRLTPRREDVVGEYVALATKPGGLR